MNILIVRIHSYTCISSLQNSNNAIHKVIISTASILFLALLLAIVSSFIVTKSVLIYFLFKSKIGHEQTL